MRARCNDIDVAWFEVGRGETLILIHGLGDDHRAWRRTLPDLMLNHRVVMYNLRGHGGTTAGRGDGTLQQLGGDLVALMDSIGIDHAHIAGFSLGGTIAMRVAIDHPARVRGLVLVATSSRVGGTAAESCGRRWTGTPPMCTRSPRPSSRTGSSSGANRRPTRVDMPTPVLPWPR